MHVNGFGLTLCASVNLVMKFIYTPCKCECKIEYIYIVLCSLIKQCIYIWFYMTM